MEIVTCHLNLSLPSTLHAETMRDTPVLAIEKNQINHKFHSATKPQPKDPPVSPLAKGGHGGCKKTFQKKKFLQGNII